MVEPHRDLIKRCVSVELEVDPKTARIFGIAAVWRDQNRLILGSKGTVEAALDRLAASLAETDCLIGHNILRHDLPHLIAARTRLARLANAMVDTLWLNPLAFPRNPYHHLVKHYQDGRLQAGHVNDPEFDARLVFEVLDDQFRAFQQLKVNAPDALTAYHYLTTRDDRSAGFDAVFSTISGATTPLHSQASEAVLNLLTARACSIGIQRTLEALSSPRLGWPTAFALSWISVAGGDSVMPHWVRLQFPEAAAIVRRLRDTSREKRYGSGAISMVRLSRLPASANR